MAKISEISAELRDALKVIKEKDDEIANLRRQLSKLQSVLSSDRQSAADTSVPIRNKKEGISAQVLSETKLTATTILKSKEESSLILTALSENDFFKNLDSKFLEELIPFMYSLTYAPDSIIIQEGTSGKEFFILKSGLLDVLDSAGNLIVTLQPGSAFGELAILYNCARTATVKSVSDSAVFVLDQSVFKSLMIREQKLKTNARLDFLLSVNLFKGVNETKLRMISDALDQEFYKQGDIIVRQGEIGTHFFIVAAGRVEVFQDAQNEVISIRKLGKGDFFGEQALLSTEKRTATVVADSEEVECLVLDRESLILYIGELEVLKTKTYEDKTAEKVVRRRIPSNLVNISVRDLKVIKTLGIGGFGRVDLVQVGSDSSKSYALKSLSKYHVVTSHQEQHIIHEKEILSFCNSPYIIQLFTTFKDSRFVYFLMEVSLGGELWTILRNKKRFSEETARFCLACVIMAIEYLHSFGIVYRDLKPENLMVDSRGYIKMVDFGFAKKIGKGNKTWTFCGTPEYVSPEVILNKGHDFGVDYWSMGILIYELLTGNPPFTGKEPLLIYKQIFKGVTNIDFPKYVGKRSRNFMFAMCKPSSLERLGYGKNGIDDIRGHSLFQGFDWPKFSTFKLKSNLVPTIKSPIDTRNFDKFPPSHQPPPEEFSGWDADF